MLSEYWTLRDEEHCVTLAGTHVNLRTSIMIDSGRYRRKPVTGKVEWRRDSHCTPAPAYKNDIASPEASNHIQADNLPKAGTKLEQRRGRMERKLTTHRSPATTYSGF